MRQKFFFILIIFFSSCVRQLDNPLDPESKFYVPPSVEIVNPQEGEIINSTSVTINWSGNRPDANEFRYRLLNYSDWSNWTTSTGATFDYLDDMEHTFEIEVKYRGQGEIRSFSRKFKIDGVRGPTLKFYKLRNVVSSAGQEITVQVWVEEVNKFKSGSFKVYFDKNAVTFTGIEKGDFIRQKGLEQIILPDFSLQRTIDDANNKGYVEVFTGVLATGSGATSLSGSGDLVKLKFRVNAIRSYVELRDIELVDEDGNRINVNPTPTAIIEIK